MRKCEHPFCNDWAQWHAIFQNEQKERIRFCGAHKLEHERKRHDVKVKYTFVGNEPCR